MIMTVFPNAPAARLALVGDRTPAVRSHGRIPLLLEALHRRDGLAIDPYWIATEDTEDTEAGALDGFDAIWLVPGSPYRSQAGALAAVRTAREHAIPFLGTCAGFQHALLEFARNVCGLVGVEHAENRPDADDLLILPLACSLVGHQGTIRVMPGSLAERILGVEQTVERYHCSYGAINPAYLDALRANGLRFTGHDQAGQVRVAELPEHPFFLTTLFQPELAGDGTRPHPIVRALAAAAVVHATAASTAAPRPAWAQ
jgi:CTP synthase (UTP-ammonia lyase)